MPACASSDLEKILKWGKSQFYCSTLTCPATVMTPVASVRKISGSVGFAFVRPVK